MFLNTNSGFSEKSFVIKLVIRLYIKSHTHGLNLFNYSSPELYNTRHTTLQTSVHLLSQKFQV